MKSLTNALIIVLVISVAFSSCKKDKSAPASTNTKGLPTPVNTIISAAIIDTLKSHGVVINEGTTPPAIEGTYYVHPFVCSFDNSKFKLTGVTFTNYTYKFSKQNNSLYTVRVDYVSSGADHGSDSTATYISGNGNLFTIFTQVNGVEDGIKYVDLEILSGEVGTNGIKNFQEALYLKSKEADPNQDLIDVGDSRVLYDSDKFSETTTFPVVAGVNPRPIHSIFLHTNPMHVASN